MIKHVAVCTECDKEVEAVAKDSGTTVSTGGTNYRLAPPDYEHPPEWIELSSMIPTLQGQRHWFCSYRCVAKYADRHGP